ncbi:unnamed protein product [Pleuronectes platessa]|uniref:Riboflavin transporter n=1 Tax=Pleuronectes platessa TaxID=8262 RepID=A0A9N7V7J7_PLEPL|nr:unnamed protein product [Pleuronectes platessa]
MSLLTHLLACLFGMGSWVAINGLWVELPLIVPQIPEGWYLPSYLSILIQMANVGPLFVTLMHHFRPGALNETAVIYVIIGLGTAASCLLGFFWKETVVVAGVSRSVALLVLTFFLATVDCTSSVTFLPFMMRLKPQYLTTYYIGEGVSGLLPALVALIQGVGVVHCLNSTQSLTHSLNGSVTFDLQAQYQPANFSPEEFFFFLSAMMLVCLVAFLLLNYHPVRGPSASHRPLHKRRERGIEQKQEVGRAEDDDGSVRTREPEAPKQFWHRSLQLDAGVLHLCDSGLDQRSDQRGASLGAVLLLPAVREQGVPPVSHHGRRVQPLACFIALFLPIRSLLMMAALTVVGTGAGAYIMGTAALSPCPLLVNDTSGGVIIVLVWILFILTLSYVKVIIGVILRDEGHSALVWCGAVVQLGSLLGAVTMFPLVSVFSFFSSGDPCNTKCP